MGGKAVPIEVVDQLLKLRDKYSGLNRKARFQAILNDETFPQCLRERPRNVKSVVSSLLHNYKNRTVAPIPTLPVAPVPPVAAMVEPKAIADIVMAEQEEPKVVETKRQHVRKEHPVSVIQHTMKVLVVDLSEVSDELLHEELKRRQLLHPLDEVKDQIASLGETIRTLESLFLEEIPRMKTAAATKTVYCPVSKDTHEKKDGRVRVAIVGALPGMEHRFIQKFGKYIKLKTLPVGRLTSQSIGTSYRWMLLGAQITHSVTESLEEARHIDNAHRLHFRSETEAVEKILYILKKEKVDVSNIPVKQRAVVNH